MRDSYRNNGTLYLCGNGGSAADCEHWSGELLKGFKSKRPLSEQEKSLLPERIADNLQGVLPCLSLPSFISLGTAFSNDVDPCLVFAQLIWGLGRTNDVLVGISTSGNAQSVISAVEVALAKKIKTIGMTGELGGGLAKKVDICIKVPESETHKIQELHLPVYHCLCLMLEEEFFSNN